MTLRSPFRRRAAALWRALSVLVVVAGAVTCDSPTAFGHRVSLVIAPVLGKLSMSGFSGLAVDSVRLKVVRPPSDTIARQTLEFSPDSASISANITVDLNAAHEQLVVLIEFLSSSQVVFTGTDTVDVVSGITTQAPAQIPISYVGPGKSIKTITITPRDSGATFGSTVQFVITATDSQNAAVSQFYVHWSAPRAGDTVNAAGVFRSAAVRGWTWVRARTPSGIWDSTRIMIAPVPSQMVIVSGDHQSGPVSAALPLPLVIQVKAADNLPVAGVPVQFSSGTSGDSVRPALAPTDSAGKVAATVYFGATTGVHTITASVVGSPSIAQASTDTAVNLHGVPATLTKIAGDTQTVAAGTAVLAQPEVQVKDAFGAVVAGASVTFTVQTGGGSVTGGTVTTDVNGLAMVGSWTLGTTAGTNTLRAAVPAVPAVSPVTFTATGKPFVVVGIAASSVAGVGRPGFLTVKLSQPDAASADTVVVTSDSTQYLLVTAPLIIFPANDTSTHFAADTGIAAGTAVVRGSPVSLAIPPRYLPGRLTVPVVTAAILLPSSLNVPLSGTAPLPITLTTPAGAGGAVITLTSSDTTKAKFTTPTVTVPASSTSVNATVQGIALGTVTLLASNPSYAPAAITATVTSGPVATVVTPHFDTLTSLTDTFRLAAQAKDGLGANVAGTFTWTSRDTTKVKVSSVGTVLAVANGSTYVVATEAFGSKDSALVTVQQRVATITVTPGTRNIYLTRTFTFSAAAVDGKGFAMPGLTTFTWSSTAPAVASPDTSHLATNVVTANGIGTAQIKAQSGVIIGVANVTVLTPITRIAVVVDSTGALTSKPDTATLVSLGITRRYRAYAFDTLNSLIPGDTVFNWVSTNGSVAVLDSTTNAVHATATSAANGVTTINATAQGFTSAPGAFLTVSQVLASIELKPDTATIGVGGSLRMTARGKDANAHYIAGGTFKYTSSTPGIATVDSLTGVVTGVSQGTGPDTITATSGALTSNKSFIVVSNTAAPSIISFGRDTLSVGRGNSQQFPVLLSKPAGAPLIVKLTSPAFAHWSTPTVTIPQGQTSVNATLVGDSAGTTMATATDSSGLGYSAGSAVVKVTANLRLTSTSYYINATDAVATQVLLSDPSPAGGTFVAFSYTKAGVAQVSPDPAFIPQGQLAADIQIRGLTGDTTHITPNAVGVNGAASYFNAYAPVIRFNTTSIRLGAGQYEPNDYVYLPTNNSTGVPVTLSSSDTTKVTVPSAAVVPAGSYYAYFNTYAAAIGSATITLSATGWTAGNTISVVSTTPHVGTCCGTTLNTTSPTTSVTVYSEDSTGSSHYRQNSLVVHLHSSDPTVIQMVDTVVTITPGTYYYSGARLNPAGLGGSAYVVATAAGHTPDSTLYTVIPPKLQFSWCCTNLLGAGQLDYNQYIYTPNNVTAPLIVAVTNSNSSAVTVPLADTIPTGTYYRYFNVLGNVPGTATFIASVTGYQPDTASYTVTTPRVTTCCNYTFNNFNTGTSLTVYSTDSTGSIHNRRSPLSVTITPLDPGVVTVDSSTVTIDSGTYYNSRAHMTPVGVGVGRIVVAAAGHISRDTVFITVQTPHLYFSNRGGAPYGNRLGRHQHFSPDTTGFYVYTPDTRAVPVPVTIVQLHGNVDSLTRLNPTIPAGNNYAYLDAFGKSIGTDTLIASATGYISDTAYVTVTTPKLGNCCMPSTGTTTNPPFGMTVYAEDSVGTGHYTMDTLLVIAAVSSKPTVIAPAQPFFKFPKNAYYTTTTVNITGPDTASITYSDSAATGYTPTTTGVITVTGPSFGISNSTPVLGMRQTGGPYGAYVYTQNNVVSNLVVTLVSTNTRVVTVPASVTILANTNYAYFQVNAMDTVGTIQVQASATGFTTASTQVQVTQPKFVISTATQLNTTSPRQSLYVYAEDANGGAHYPTENVTVTLTSSASGVATIDSATVTIPTSNYYSYAATWGPVAVGTAQLTASDARSTFYKYNSGSVNISVVTPSLNFGGYPGALGFGQYLDYVYPYTPDYATSPISVSFTHTGTARTGTSTNLTNTAITGVVIPTSQNYQYFRLTGLSIRGTDTLVASVTSPAHNPATLYTVVDSGRVDPLSGWPGTIKAGDSVLVTLYARDPNTSVRTVVASTQFTLAPNANIEFHLGGATVTSVTIPADQQYVQFYLKGLTAGTGNVTITNANYKTYTNTLTVTP